MKIGLARGRAAMTAADQAAARGDLTGTRDPLREFVGLADLPTAKEAPLLVGEGAPASVKEFGELASAARDRLRDLRGKEAEFEAIRTAQERAAVAAGLGGKLESDLRQFSLTSARVRLEQAAELTSDGDLSGRLRGLAADLDGAQRALDGLIEGWKDPGWRRRGVIDPRAGGNASVLGTAPGALVLEADGGPRKVPLAQWAANPKALDNLFKGRLDRSWSPDVEAGIVTLMGLSASLQLIDAFSPALQADARRISRSEAADALQAFSKVQDWVEKAPGTAKAAARQRDAGRLLAEAMMARQDGDWPLCASLLQRLLDENRADWIVMWLSDGNTNQ